MGTGASLSTIFCHSCGNRTRGDTMCQNCGSTTVERTDARFPVREGTDTMVATVEAITIVADSVDEDNGLLLRVAPRLVYRPVPEDDEVESSPAAKTLVDRLEVQPYKKEEDACGDSVCVICSLDLQGEEKSIKLPCSHIFHNECIKTWLEAQHTCPTCRYELEVDDAKYLRSIGLPEQAKVVDAAKIHQAKMSADNEAEERHRWWRAMCRGIPVHFGLQCTLCRQTPIIGTTYHCCLCENTQATNGVYLCENCYGLEVPATGVVTHEGDHLFLPVELPAGEHNSLGNNWRQRIRDISEDIDALEQTPTSDPLNSLMEFPSSHDRAPPLSESRLASTEAILSAVGDSFMDCIDIANLLEPDGYRNGWIDVCLSNQGMEPIMNNNNNTISSESLPMDRWIFNQIENNNELIYPDIESDECLSDQDLKVLYRAISPEPNYPDIEQDNCLSDQDLKIIYRSISPANDNFDDLDKDQDGIDELILTSVEEALLLNSHTPELLTPETTARTEKSLAELLEDPENRYQKLINLQTERSDFEKILDNESLKLKCANPISDIC